MLKACPIIPTTLLCGEAQCKSKKETSHLLEPSSPVLLSVLCSSYLRKAIDWTAANSSSSVMVYALVCGKPAGGTDFHAICWQQAEIVHSCMMATAAIIKYVAQILWAS